MSPTAAAKARPATTRRRKDDLRIDRLWILWEEDRRTTFSGQSCTTRAQVSYRLETGDRRLEWFTSGGLFGIDDGSSTEYRDEVAIEQLEDLRLHLRHFGIDPDDQEWNRLVAEVYAR